VKPSMTPKGVEHPFHSQLLHVTFMVKPSMTPKGVEHKVQRKQWLSARSETSMTPKGVEHPTSSRTWPIFSSGETFHDAERR